MQNIINNFGSVWAFLGLVVGFGFLIFVHELGHFLVAKWVGIKVTQFAIGFGHCLVSWRRGVGWRRGSSEREYEKLLTSGADEDSIGETEYRLNWMPLGGYVKMVGQDDLDPTATSDDPRSFNRKPVWARACVISAGVVMNLIFAVVLFVVAFMAGVKFPSPTVGSVIPGSPASQAVAKGSYAPQVAGIQPGDRILEIDGHEVHDFLDVRVNTALASGDKPIHLVVQREGLPHALEYEITPEHSPNEEILWLGLTPASSLTVGRPENIEDLPAVLAQAGITPGMRIAAVAELSRLRITTALLSGLKNRKADPWRSRSSMMRQAAKPSRCRSKQNRR